MREIQACGVFVVRGDPPQSFLLLKHTDRWDLPKGHREAGESEIECALRELQEETGVGPDDIELAPDFRFTIDYVVPDNRFGEPCHKTVVIFLGRLLHDMPIHPTEHEECQWFRWKPPHRIQAQTIDPLLAQVERYYVHRKIVGEKGAGH
jgi:8-oxo-dGTP pyrophosphatase MutT (NUDIX family)